jgi:hypothetical protein
MLAGIAGALAMSAAMALLRWAGVPVSLEYLLSTLAGSDGGQPAWWTGFAIHLAIGAVVALLYAVGFEYAVQRAGALVGGVFGLAHGLMAGLFMSAIPAMNSLTTVAESSPGAFMRNVEFGPAIFLGLHVLFGMVLGVVYGHPAHKPHLLKGRTV